MLISFSYLNYMLKETVKIILRLKKIWLDNALPKLLSGINVLSLTTCTWGYILYIYVYIFRQGLKILIGILCTKQRDGLYCLSMPSKIA